MGLLQPAYKEGYSLLYGSMHFYLVFKTIASIYERLVKAQLLIAEKVNQDLQKEEIVQLIEAATGKSTDMEAVKKEAA